MKIKTPPPKSKLHTNRWVVMVEISLQFNMAVSFHRFMAEGLSIYIFSRLRPRKVKNAKSVLPSWRWWRKKFNPGFVMHGLRYVLDFAYFSAKRSSLLIYLNGNCRCVRNKVKIIHLVVCGCVKCEFLHFPWEVQVIFYFIYLIKKIRKYALGCNEQATSP